MFERDGEADVRRVEAEENLTVDFQFLLQSVLNKHGLSRADLARLTGLSKARITQLMKDDANPQLRTMANIFFALGEELQLGVRTEAKAVVQPHKAKEHLYSFEQVEASRSEPARASARPRHFERERECLRAYEAVFTLMEMDGGLQPASNDNPGYEALLEYATA